MKQDWFIDMDFMEETDKIEDLLNIDAETEKIKTRLQSLNKSCIYWLIWPFGSGKSVCLNKVSKQFTTAKRITFDAWQYPERKDLRENFVLEIARQIDKDTFNETIKNIDWKQNDDKKALVNTISDIPIPWFSCIKNFNHFLDTSPAKRTFEVQNILIEAFKKIKEDTIYIVLEDIDRSGTEWVYFLETLKNFLDKTSKENIVSKRIICICPMDNDSLEKQWNSYIKCIEYYDFFKPAYNWEKFVRKGFIINNYEEDLKKLIIDCCIFSFHRLIEKYNIRELKFIIRHINESYKKKLIDHSDINWIIYFFMSLIRYEKNIQSVIISPKNSIDLNSVSWKNPKTISFKDFRFFIFTVLFNLYWSSHIFGFSIDTEFNINISVWENLEFVNKGSEIKIPAYYLDD